MSSNESAFFIGLSQVAATFVSLMAAGLIAYFVYCEQRVGNVRDEIETQQNEIIEAIGTLRARMYQVPVIIPDPKLLELFQQYLDEHTYQTSTTSLVLFARELIWPGESKVLESLRREYRDDESFLQSRRRLGLIVMRESLKRVLGFDVEAATALAKPDKNVPAQLLFPSSPVDAGYLEWRLSFSQLHSIMQELKVFSTVPTSVADLVPASLKNADASWLANFESFNDTYDVQSRVMISSISKIEMLSRKLVESEPRNRVSVLPTLCLLILVSAIGIFTPLWLCTVSADCGPICMRTILFTTAFLSLGLLLQLRADVVKSYSDSRAEYLRVRWLKPLSSALEFLRANIDNGKYLNFNMLVDVANLSQPDTIDPVMQSDLRRMSQLIREYNESLSVFQEEVEALILHSELATYDTSPGLEGQGWSLDVGLLLSPADFDAAMTALRAPVILSIERSTSFGSHNIKYSGRTSNPADIDSFRRILLSICETAKKYPSAIDFESKRESLRKQFDSVTKRLNAA